MTTKTSRQKRLAAFAAQWAHVTEPGVMALAVLRYSPRPVPARVLERAVWAVLPGARYGNDLAHCRRMGYVVRDPEADAYALGPNADAIPMPAEGPQMGIAGDALAEARYVFDLLEGGGA